MVRRISAALFAFGLLGVASASANPAAWQREWPRTDFSKTAVDYSEILSGGPPKDGIPSIDEPEFKAIAEVDHLGDMEPVIGVVINGDARAYPLQVLIWHEIVNDTVGGVPVSVTFCPLCNTGLVFDRRLGGRVLDFGTTGKLRNSDLVMYDRQTESWWQQFLGEAIVGELTGARLTLVPVRLESFARFRARAPAGQVLVPSRPVRSYGRNPYVSYDSRSRPYGFFRGDLPTEIAPLARVVTIGDEAWSLEALREKRMIEAGGLILTWEPGQNSALDSSRIAKGMDVGNVIVQRRAASGKLEDAPYSVDFAFAFRAFHPKGVIHVRSESN